MRARDAWLRQGALLASACALMLAVGLAASVAAPRPVTLEVGREVGPGTYKIPFKDANGARKALVFTVPAGIRIELDVVGRGTSSCGDSCDETPAALFSGGDGSDVGFGICIDLQAAEECWRDYPYSIVLGEPVNDVGRPVRISDEEYEADQIARAAKYGPLLDRLVASARIEGATGCTEVTLGGSRAGNAALAADCDVLLPARDTLASGDVLNWSASTPLSEWDGVTVAGAPPRVVGLDLHARGLGGSIPPQLGSLTALTALDLSDNALSWGLPAGLRDLPPTLATLRLAGNAVMGCIDERLRLAVTNDLATLMKERGLSWCPVAAMPGRTALGPGTWQIDGNLIVDIPQLSPQVMWSAIEGYDADSGPSLVYCLSDLSEREEICLDAYSGVEVGRGMVDKYRRGGGAAAARSETVSGESGETTTPVPGLNAVFDKIAASARPAP